MFVQTESEIWNSRRKYGSQIKKLVKNRAKAGYLHTETKKSGVPGSDFLKFSPG